MFVEYLYQGQDLNSLQVRFNQMQTIINTMSESCTSGNVSMLDTDINWKDPNYIMNDLDIPNLLVKWVKYQLGKRGESQTNVFILVPKIQKNTLHFYNKGFEYKVRLRSLGEYPDNIGLYDALLAVRCQPFLLFIFYTYIVTAGLHKPNFLAFH